MYAARSFAGICGWIDRAGIPGRVSVFDNGLLRLEPVSSDLL